MKKIFLLLSLLLIGSFLHANMASPIVEGTATGLPFVSEYVTVRHESIRILPGTDFKTCRFEVVYDIFADSAGIRIPMLFVALGYEDGMKITVDGVPVGFGKLPNEAYIRENSPKSRFQDPETQSDIQEVRISFREGERRIYDLSDLHFFEFDLAAGAHQIQVVYEARQWRDRSDYVAEAYFLYTLSPAKYWKSFGQLDVTLDARGLPFPVVTNLGAPTSGDLKGEAKWHFDKLPEVETIQVSWKPEVNATAKFMISIGEGGFFWFSWVVFALLHFAAIWWWRRKHIGKWFSWTWLIGSILIPALICFVYVQSENWIDAAIGPAASGFGSYSFLIIIFYPVFLVGHGAVMLFADYLIRRYRGKRA